MSPDVRWQDVGGARWSLPRGFIGGLWADSTMCPPAVSRGCPLTAISLRRGLAARSITQPLALSSKGISGMALAPQVTRVEEHRIEPSLCQGAVSGRIGLAETAPDSEEAQPCGGWSQANPRTGLPDRDQRVGGANGAAASARAPLGVGGDLLGRREAGADARDGAQVGLRRAGIDTGAWPVAPTGDGAICSRTAPPAVSPHCLDMGGRATISVPPSRRGCPWWMTTEGGSSRRGELREERSGNALLLHYQLAPVPCDREAPESSALPASGLDVVITGAIHHRLKPLRERHQPRESRASRLTPMTWPRTD